MHDAVLSARHHQHSTRSARLGGRRHQKTTSQSVSRSAHQSSGRRNSLRSISCGMKTQPLDAFFDEQHAGASTRFACHDTARPSEVRVDDSQCRNRPHRAESIRITEDSNKALSAPPPLCISRSINSCICVSEDSVSIAQRQISPHFGSALFIFNTAPRSQISSPAYNQTHNKLLGVSSVNRNVIHITRSTLMAMWHRCGAPNAQFRPKSNVAAPGGCQ